MKAAQTKDSRPPSFETVWVSLQELSESQKETDRLIKELRESQKEEALKMNELRESQKETALQMKETDRQIKEFNKRFGDFTNRFGEVVEYMIAPNLCEKFREFGFIFHKSNSGTSVSDNENDIHFEIDIMLENSDKALLVEVKNKLTTEDVKEHLERLDKMRRYADLHGDKRSFLGAAAGVIMTPYVKKYALGHGLFVIEPSGESFNITPPYNKPKEW